MLESASEGLRKPWHIARKGMIGLVAAASLALAGSAPAAQIPVQSKVCSSSALTVTPVSRCPAVHSLCFRGAMAAPIGVSADASCHLPLALPQQLDSCNLTNSLEYVNSMDGPAIGFGDSLNKMQLWVSLGKKYNVTSRSLDQPFEWVSGSPGYYRLDRQNTSFFRNLRDVVAYAESRDILVEVVFFAPWEGSVDSTAFTDGPWKDTRNKVCVDAQGKETGAASCPSAQLVAAGFATQSGFFQAPAAGTAAVYGRNAQLRVIEWTLNELWCFDNVYYQIANEPDNGNVGRKVVAAWHRDMIDKVVLVENARVGSPGLTQRHLISVNPSYQNTETTVGAPARFYYLDPPADYTLLGQIDIINGHYTELYGGRDLGALQLIRTFGAEAVSRGKLLGFNENKISGIAEDNSSTLPGGGVESARAEGWEFMLNFGAVYDHWGFDADNDVGSDNIGTTVRNQLRKMKTFVNGLLRRQVKQSGSPGVAAPAWVPTVGNYAALASGNTRRRYWAALEPSSTATKKQYVLYLHNSLRRCQDPAQSDPGCTPDLPFNGFKPVIGSYSENLTLNLAAATYNVEWIDPKQGIRPTTWPARTLVHSGANSCTIDGGPSISPCKIATPVNYTYDIALKITQQ